jgi:hypothetical protein
VVLLLLITWYGNVGGSKGDVGKNHILLSQLPPAYLVSYSQPLATESIMSKHTKHCHKEKFTKKRGRPVGKVSLVATVEVPSKEMAYIRNQSMKMTENDPTIVIHWHDGAVGDALLALARGVTQPPVGEAVALLTPPPYLRTATTA